MAKAKNIKFSSDEQEQFSALAICSAEPDTRMAWLLNRALHVDFVNREDLWGPEVDGLRRPFALFEAESPAHELGYKLLANRTESTVLVKAYANIDYLLKLSRELAPDELQALREAIRSIPSVTLCLDISGDARLLANL